MIYECAKCHEVLNVVPAHEPGRVHVEPCAECIRRASVDAEVKAERQWADQVEVARQDGYNEADQKRSLQGDKP